MVNNSAKSGLVHARGQIGLGGVRLLQNPRSLRFSALQPRNGMFCDRLDVDARSASAPFVNADVLAL